MQLPIANRTGVKTSGFSVFRPLGNKTFTNARISPANNSGTPMAAKFPHFGIPVPRAMVVIIKGSGLVSIDAWLLTMLK